MLAIMMMLSVVPFYASAAQIELTEANVVSYPTAEGTIYAGQKFGDYITLKGGEVRYDANGNGTLDEDETVAGAFEIIEDDANATAGVTIKQLTIKFVPADTETYSEIAISKSSSGISIQPLGRPVTIIEYPVADEVEAGTKLRNVKLTGGVIIDNETQEVVEVKTWRWKILTATVTESGYQELNVMFTSSLYKISPIMIYVRVKGDTSEVKLPTQITERPTIEQTIYTGTKASDIELIGGKATDINGTELSGKFVLQDENKVYDTAGKFSDNVVFIPDDENYGSSSINFSIEVVEKETVNMEIRSASAGLGADHYIISKVLFNSTTPKGTFDIYVDGELFLEGAKSGDSFVFAPENSGEYAFKMVYNPTEDDTFVVPDFEKIFLKTYERKCTLINTTVSTGEYYAKYGQEVTVRHNLGEDFDHWEIIDTNGNPVEIEKTVDTVKITFVMPDYDITVKAVAKSASGGDSGGSADLGDIFGDFDLGSLTEGDGNVIENVFNNIIALFKNIIETLKGLFRSIGDNT